MSQIFAQGLVCPLDKNNVDTDQIIPKQFLTSVSRDGFAEALFYDWRYLANETPNPDFVLNEPAYKGASILLTRANFGCGSSREHAAWALGQIGGKEAIPSLKRQLSMDTDSWVKEELKLALKRLQE